MLKITKKEAQDVARVLKETDKIWVALLIDKSLKNVKVVIKRKGEGRQGDREFLKWQKEYMERYGEQVLIIYGQYIKDVNRLRDGKNTIKDLTPVVYNYINKHLGDKKARILDAIWQEKEKVSGKYYYIKGTRDFYLVEEDGEGGYEASQYETDVYRNAQGYIDRQPDINEPMDDFPTRVEKINGKFYYFGEKDKGMIQYTGQYMGLR